MDISIGNAWQVHMEIAHSILALEVGWTAFQLDPGLWLVEAQEESHFSDSVPNTIGVPVFKFHSHCEVYLLV